MTRRPDRTALRAKLAGGRARLKGRRRRPDSRRRGLWLLLLVLAWFCCSGSPPPPPLPPDPVEAPAEAEPGAATPVPALPDPRIGRVGRPSFSNGPAEPLPWVTAFRLQVAARSPRLALCFVGAEAPGALKWTAAVEPESGRVSDHTLESVRETVLDAAQRACVLGVLSDPPYRLPSGGEATPSRVSMAIEF